jgi:hypothetical protein
LVASFDVKRHMPLDATSCENGTRLKPMKCSAMPFARLDATFTSIFSFSISAYCFESYLMSTS